MTNVLTILGGKLYDKARDIARREGTRRPSTPPLRPMPPAPRLQGGSTKGLLVGKVRSHVGLSRSATYSIELEDGTILNGKTPRRRGELAGPEFDIRPAADGTPCYYSIQQVNGQPVVVLHSCEEEIDSEACAALPGSGTAGGSATTGAVVTATEQANTPFRPRTKLIISWTIDITNLTTDRYGLLLYTFPVGAIDIQSVVADLVISSSNVTNGIEIGIGTDDASGSSGQLLSGDQENVVAGTNPGNISASLDYHRFMPDSRDAAGSILVRLAATGTLGTSMGDVTWDTEVYKDSDLFTFSASSTDITIVEDGVYELSYDLTAEWVSTATNNAVGAQLVKNGTLITGTGGNDEILGSSAGRATISKRFITSLAAGDVIKLQAQRGAGNTSRIAANTTNLMIRKIPVERNRRMLHDGTSAAKALYLNIATKLFSWNATGQVAITGTIWLNWTSAGAFDG